MAKTLAPALELTDDDRPQPPSAEAPVQTGESRPVSAGQQHMVPLPPIPPGRSRVVMIQLSVKQPVDLVERLDRMTNTTGALKQEVIRLALESYLAGHGY